MAGSPVNFRTFIVVALSVGAAVFCVYVYSLNYIVGMVFASAYTATIVFITIMVIYKYITKRTKLRYAVAAALSFVLGISAFAVGAYTADDWRKGEACNGNCSVLGRVCAVDFSSGDYKFVIEDLYLNGKPVVGKMRVTVLPAENNAAEHVATGDKLSFEASVRHVKLISGFRINGNAYRTNIRYNVSVRGDALSVVFGAPSALEKFTAGLRELLVENMGEKYGNIAFSMLTGDKYALDGEIKDYFTAAGLGHIMAVSGLHIGFLIFVLNFVLYRLSKKVRFPIILAAIAGYTVLADFSPSVVRAVIMAVISGFAVFVGGRKDLLSSLLCAFSFILAVKPMYLFDAGFLLSFAAIFGIALFANSIRLFMAKRGAHNKIASGIGASVSVSVAVTPVQTYFFGQIQLLSVIANVILLPFVSVVFITLVATLPIAAIPYCGGILHASKYLLVALDYAAQGIAAVPFTVITVKTSAAVFLCYPIMFCASGYFMMNKGKTAVILYSAAVCVLICYICAA